MAVDNVATKVRMQQHLSVARSDDQMRNKAKLIYVIAYQYGVDVTTRHYHARQHTRGRSVATHTPVMQAWDRKPNFPSAVQSGTVQSPYRRCTTGTPAVRVYSVSHACYISAAQDHPVYIKII